MVMTTVSVLATVIAGLILMIAAAVERQAEGFGARVASEVKYWQRGAFSLFFITLIPAFISRPTPELAEAVYDSLSALAPFFLLLGLLCFIASLSKLIPAWRRHQAQRAEAARRREIAARGGPYPELSAAVVHSIRQCLPDMDVQADRRDEQGNHANLIAESEQEKQRYIVYALPREHLHRPGGAGLNPNALNRACNVAAAFDGRPILWAPLPQHGTPQGYYATHDSELRPYVVEGKDIHLAEAIKKFELTARSERRRREAREAARAAEEGDPRYHVPVRSETPAQRARQQHDRESWERFNVLAPRHPHMREVVERRTRLLCDRCLNRLPEEGGKVVPTDHDHICKNDASVRMVLDESNEPITQTMPDCGQCHYENPELYEECVSRLTLVHPGECPPSPDDPEEQQRQADYEHRQRMAELERSLK